MLLVDGLKEIKYEFRKKIYGRFSKEVLEEVSEGFFWISTGFFEGISGGICKFV